MRIGWLSASPTATTGYGGQTLEVCDRLMERHEVVCIGQTGDLIVWGGRQRVDTPSGRKLSVVALSDPRSAADLINRYYVPEYDLDIILGFMDAFGIEFLNDVSVPVIGWIPIDGPFTSKWKNYVRNFHRVIAYSRFGYGELQKWFPPAKIGYIPHGVSEEFRPLDRNEVREEFEKEYGVPKDAFLAVNVGANVGCRKELPLMMRTFKRFVEDGHDDAYLFIHTNAHGTYPRGYDLPMWRAMLGMEEHVLFPDYNPILSPVSNARLARVHNAGDVYWQNSVAEGFMLPGYEAMACGIPVICPRNSAQVEIAEGNGPRRGWLVESVPEDAYVQIPVYVPQLPCLPPDTLISTPFGDLPIKTIVEQRLPFVYGYENGKVVSTKVLIVSDRYVDEDLILLETEYNYLGMTKEHPAFVSGIGYVEAKGLKRGSVTLSLSNHAPKVEPYREPEEAEVERGGIRVVKETLLGGIFEGGDSKAFRALRTCGTTSGHNIKNQSCEDYGSEVDEYLHSTIKGRVGLSSWDCRWGGNYKYNPQASKEEKLFLPPLNVLYCYFGDKRRTERVDVNSRIQRGIFPSTRGFEVPRLESADYWIPHVFISKGDATLPEGEEKGVRVSNEIFGNQSGASSNVWIHPRRGRGLQTTPNLTLFKEEITLIKRYSYKGKVYNIKTGTGNFFANGILVHNCYPVPDQRSALEKLGEAYNSPDLREEYGRAARKYIEKYHNWGLVMGKWFRALDEVEAELGLFRRLGEALSAAPLAQTHRASNSSM